MNQETPVPMTCEIGFRPKSESSRKRIHSIVLQASRLTMPTTATWRFCGDRFLITGIGFDGRCSLCREIRHQAKLEGLLFSSRCRYERDDKFSWRVRVGGTSYDITLLESESYYLQRKAADPTNVLVRTHLAVIAETRGELAKALGEYLAVLKLHPDDKFTQRRIAEVSTKLLAQKKALIESARGLEMIASS